jgi:uncharacterized protein (TIGR02594 family)
VTDLPWMTWARAQIGTRETPGAGNTPKIMTWAQRVGAKALGIPYTADATPWCGLFAAAAVAQAGFKPPPIAIRASQWRSWGREANPRVGAVLVFERSGGGHVGFYEAERADAYYVLGGNQSDAVTRTWIAKDRCVGVRWPFGANVPPGPGRVFSDAKGKLSTNEA